MAVFFILFCAFFFFSRCFYPVEVFTGSANSPSHEFSEDQGYLLVSFLYYFFFIVCDRDQPTSPFIIIIGIFTKSNKDDDENQDH